ncbi:sulfate/molybdate ABC transporter ATP-binding protein [Sinomonas halotolerans]|uniref:ATP-binding cassette domain-containing protein n=1 Tax=Sinomonas halotolerans TaxID=1644133 RepID=A0ABU9WXK6_9MICC
MNAYLTVDAGLAARGVRLAVGVGQGERVAVMGPNGAGKSTLFGLCAGLLRPDEGRVALGGQVLADASGAWIPPHRRGIALLAQEPLLFPHLSVLENVAFAPRAAGAQRGAARAAAGRWLEEVGASALADRRPAELSGGQAQRVAIARALAAEPRVLLLDEPFAALDVDAAPALRRLLRRVLAGRTALVITHEPLDAHLLADRVLVLEGGRAAEDGSTAEVLERPRSRFAAGLAGLNLLQGIGPAAAAGAGTSRSSSAAASSGTAAGARISIEGLGEVSGTVPEGADQPAGGEAAVAVFRPADVSVFAPHDAPHGSPRNVWPATVLELEPRGAHVRVHCAPGTEASRPGVAGPSAGEASAGAGAAAPGILADLTPAAAAELDLVPGAGVVLVVKATAVSVYAVG